jgi:hypothetical protein
MSAPALVIRLEVEAAPRLMCDVMSESEEERLIDWLDAHPELIDLVVRAFKLGDLFPEADRKGAS